MLITSLIISTILSCLAGIGCAYWLLEKRLKKQSKNYERKLREAQEKIYDIEETQQQEVQLLHTQYQNQIKQLEAFYQQKKQEEKNQALEAEHQKHTIEKVQLENQLREQIKSLENEHIKKQSIIKHQIWRFWPVGDQGTLNPVRMLRTFCNSGWG